MNYSGNDLVYIVIFGIVIMLLLIMSMFIFFMISQRKKNSYLLTMQKMREEQQNLLIEAAVRSEEIERHRIAEELHDEVGALLSSTKLHFNAINVEDLDQEDQSIHGRSKELLDDSIQKVRGIAHNLHSSILKELGLHEAIKNFIQKLTKGGMIHTEFHFDDRYVSKQPERDISVYRMVQELLNNILKYANASILSVSSKTTDDALHISLNHNGDGLSQEAFETLRYKPDGLGLKNIQNRIILLKGNIQFTKNGAGSGIEITIPNV